ncbi:MAG: aquaporin [Actinomycetota bacterium]
MNERELIGRCAAEGAGTALLVAALVGGASAAAAAGASAFAATATGATAAALVLHVLVAVLGPVSGGYFNPAICFSLATAGRLPSAEAAAYVLAQLGGGFVGATAANVLWGAIPIVGPSSAILPVSTYVTEAVTVAALVGAVHVALRSRRTAQLPTLLPAIMLAASLALPVVFANPAVALGVGVAGGSLSLGSLFALFVVQLTTAAAAAALVASISTGDVERAIGRQVVEVDLGPFAATADPRHVHRALTATIRPGDRVRHTSDGRWLVHLGDTDPAAADAIADRLGAVAQLALGLAADAPVNAPSTVGAASDPASTHVASTHLAAFDPASTHVASTHLAASDPASTHVASTHLASSEQGASDGTTGGCTAADEVGTTAEA